MPDHQSLEDTVSQMLDESRKPKTKTQGLKRFSVGTLAFIFGSIGLISTQFGLGLQKGMTQQMGLGNISGNYDLHELLYASIFALSYILKSLIKWAENAHLGLVIATIGVLCVVFYLSITKIKSSEPPEILVRYREKFVSAILFLYLTIIAILSKAIIVTMVLVIPATLAIPFFLGASIGAHYVKEEITDLPCVKLREVLEQNQGIPKNLHQCTHTVIGGELVQGSLIMESSDAFFIQTNHAFVRLNKNGNNCVYAGYISAKVVEHRINTGEPVEFTNNDLPSFCKSASENEQGV